MFEDEAPNHVGVRLADGSCVAALLPDGLSTVSMRTPRAACKVLVYIAQAPDSPPRRELPDAGKHTAQPL